MCGGEGDLSSGVLIGGRDAGGNVAEGGGVSVKVGVSRLETSFGEKEGVSWVLLTVCCGSFYSAETQGLFKLCVFFFVEVVSYRLQ